MHLPCTASRWIGLPVHLLHGSPGIPRVVVIPASARAGQTSIGCTLGPRRLDAGIPPTPHSPPADRGVSNEAPKRNREPARKDALARARVSGKWCPPLISMVDICTLWYFHYRKTRILSLFKWPYRPAIVLF